MSSAAGTRSAGHYRLTSTTSPRWPIDATWASIPAVATATASPSQAARLGISLGPAAKAAGPASLGPHLRDALPWRNRFSLEVSDLAAMVEELRKADVHFRNDIVTGVGGKQILLDDPSGNPIELFEPTLPEASLSSAETRDD